MSSVYEDRKQHFRTEKRYIGIYTADYLRRNALNLPIAVDGGSTNLVILQEICRDVREGRPTVSQILTNHVEALMASRGLPDDRGPVWIGTGGQFRPSRCVFAEGAERAVADRQFWLAVVGANGFQPPWIETTTEREQATKRAMILQARTKIVFAIDTSKWGVPAGKRLHTLDEIAASGKEVVLLTCYPIQDTDETDPAFRHRVDRFVTTAEHLVGDWQFDCNILSATVTAEGMVAANTTLSCGSGLAAELKHLHSAIIPRDQMSDIGLALAFELNCSKC